MVHDPELDALAWLTPWASLEQSSREELEQELQRELAPGHVLFGRELWALGRRQDQDDVLFVVNAVDGPRQFAVVHLTYARETRSDRPHTMMFGSLEEFVDACMAPDHAEFTDEDVD